MTTLKNNTPTPVSAPAVNDDLSVKTDHSISDCDGMEAIAQLNDLMIKLSEVMQKLRDVLQQYNQKQQELGWDIQKASMDTKKEAISKACESSILSGVLQIGAGIAGMAGAGFSKSTGLGEATTHIGKGVGDSLSGIGTVVSAEMTKNAEIEKTEGEFQSMNAQSYTKNIGESREKAMQISEQMRSLVKDLVELHGRISSAVKN